MIPLYLQQFCMLLACSWILRTTISRLTVVTLRLVFYAKGTISSFNNFLNIIHCIEKFGNQCKIKWRKTKTETERRKIKEGKRTRKRRERGCRFKICN